MQTLLACDEMEILNWGKKKKKESSLVTGYRNFRKKTPATKCLPVKNKHLLILEKKTD